MKVIRAVAFADETDCPFAGQYLQAMDFEAHGGMGFAEWTSDLAKAMKFAGPGEAFTFWRTTSKTRPKRPDGKPNRPLTCTTIEICDPDAEPLAGLAKEILDIVGKK